MLKSVRYFLLFVTAVAGSALAERTASAAGDPPTLTARIATEAGAAYIAARDEALALAPESFDALLQELERTQAMPKERTIARALRLRRQNAALAQQFDQDVEGVLAHPDLGSRSGRPRYAAASLLRPDRSTDPLYFELLLKGTHLPDEFRWWGLGGPMPRDANGQRYPELADAYMALLETEGAPLNHVSAALVKLVQQFPDERAIGAIAAAYKRYRLAHPQDFKGVSALANLADHLAVIGGEDAKAALQDLIAFERTQMVQNGWAPWDDAEAKHRLEAADAAWHQASTLPNQSSAEVAAARAAWEEAFAAYERRSLWSALTKARQDLDAPPSNPNP